MIGVIAKTFFEPGALVRRKDRADRRFLFKAGAAVRTRARRKIRRSKKASSPGRPPRTRRGQLRRAIFFGVELEKKTVVIGPAYSRVGEAGKAHEHGGLYRGGDFPQRPFMGPAQQETQEKLPDIWADAFK